MTWQTYSLFSAFWGVKNPPKVQFDRQSLQLCSTRWFLKISYLKLLNWRLPYLWDFLSILDSPIFKTIFWVPFTDMSSIDKPQYNLFKWWTLYEREGIYFWVPMFVFSHSLPKVNACLQKSNTNGLSRCLIRLIFHFTTASLSSCQGKSADTVWLCHLLCALWDPQFVHTLAAWLE